MALAVSGGVDSTVLAFEQASENRLGPMVFCDFGQPNARQQEILIRKQAAAITKKFGCPTDVHVLKVMIPPGMLKGRPFKSGAVGPAKPYKSVEDVYADDKWDINKDQDNFAHVPARNTLIALYTGMISVEQEAEPSVAMAFQYEAEQWDSMDYINGDSNVDFFHHLGAFLEHPLDVPVLLDMPFIQRRWSKTDIIEHGIDLGVNFEDTWSCEFGERCWECVQCLITKRAMSALEHETRAFPPSKQLILPFRESRIAL